MRKEMKNIIYMMYVQPILLCWDAHGGQDESILTNKKKKKKKMTSYIKI